jgi:adenylate cyclase
MTDQEPAPRSAQLDIVKTVFEHRLQQSDLNRIITQLSGTDRDQLVAEIGKLLDRISALIDVTNKVSDSLSLDVLLPRLIGIITDSLDAERSTLFLNDPETNELFSRVAEGDKIGEIRFPNHVGIAGSVFTAGQSEIINDAYADSRFNQEFDKKTGFRTRNILCAVMNVKGKVIGVTQVLNKKSGDFDRDDLVLLSALTAQASSALENARLFERVQKAREEEAQLLEVTSAIAAELNLDVLLKKIIGVTTQMLDADRATLFIYDAKNDQLFSRVAMGLETKEIRIPSAAGIAGACFTSGETINIPDAYADERFNPAVDKKTGYRTRSILCMPVKNKDGEKLGVVQVLNKRGGPFAPIDEKRLDAFTAQAAIALDNAKLFADVSNERNYNESILKSLSNGVLTLREDGAVEKINSAARKILDLDAEETEQRSLRDILPEKNNPLVFAALQRVVASGKTETLMDSEVATDAEKSVSANLSVVPLVDVEESNIGSMLIIDDITSEKRVKSTMARYMTAEVANKLLEGGESALGGTAQNASVLFSDIRQFTTLSETLGPRDTVAMLNEYFSEMIDVIFANKGILDKYIGDAIMAIFGAPFPGEQDAENAVKTAVGMIRSLRAFNEKRGAAGVPTLNIGIGVSTGELIAGNIGSLKRMDYTVIGDTVNLASRLEGVTKMYGAQIVLDEATVEKLPDPGRVRKLDLITVKGQTKPVTIYEALDYHDETTYPELDRVLELHKQAVTAYQARDWKRSLDLFQKIFKLNNADGPCQIYLSRVRHYMDEPPPADWDGVFELKIK